MEAGIDESVLSVMVKQKSTYLVGPDCSTTEGKETIDGLSNEFVGQGFFDQPQLMVTSTLNPPKEGNNNKYNHHHIANLDEVGSY